jgi:hypothetical protein
VSCCRKSIGWCYECAGDIEVVLLVVEKGGDVRGSWYRFDLRRGDDETGYVFLVRLMGSYRGRAVVNCSVLLLEHVVLVMVSCRKSIGSGGFVEHCKGEKGGVVWKAMVMWSVVGRISRYWYRVY